MHSISNWFNPYLAGIKNPRLRAIINYTCLFLLLNTSAFYTHAQLATRPIARFSFNNADSEDEISRQKIKLVGASYTEDRFGNANHAVFLSGNADSYINLGNSNKVKPKTGSIVLWIKIENAVWAGKGIRINPILITRCDTSADFYEAFSIHYELDTKKVAFSTTKDSTLQVNHFTSIFKQNKWHQIVVTYDFNTSVLYLDGKLQSRLPKKFETRFLLTDSVLIGNTGSKKNERYLKADVDDIEFYDKVLTEDEVQELFNTPNPNKNSTILNWLLEGLILIIIIILLYFLIKHQLKKGILKEKQHLELQNKLLETELRVNRASMNPHFLFNSLNALHNFILNNEIDNASDYLVKFSKIIRKILDSNMHESISLELEIELLERYLEIENLRFEENIIYTISIEESLPVSSITIPIMMLQPFIENAIWHGLLNKKGEKIISISFSLYQEKYISCIIEDNGTGRKKNEAGFLEKKSLATAFVLQRLELLNKIHRLNSSLVIEDKPDNTGTIVKITLPILNK